MSNSVVEQRIAEVITMIGALTVELKSLSALLVAEKTSKKMFRRASFDDQVLETLVSAARPLNLNQLLRLMAKTPELKTTENTLRKHVNKLAGSGLVKIRGELSTRGRYVMTYSATQRGIEHTKEHQKNESTDSELEAHEAC